MKPISDKKTFNLKDLKSLSDHDKATQELFNTLEFETITSDRLKLRFTDFSSNEKFNVTIFKDRLLGDKQMQPIELPLSVYFDFAIKKYPVHIEIKEVNKALFDSESNISFTVQAFSNGEQE